MPLIMQYKTGIGSNPALDTLAQTLSSGSARQIQGDSSGNYYISGTNGMVSKLNSAGVLQWSKQINGSENPLSVKDITVDSSGNVWVVGWDEVYNPQTDQNDLYGMVVELNSSGVIQSNRHYDGQLGVDIATDGTDIFVSGNDHLVKITASTGAIAWQKEFSGGDSAAQPGQVHIDSSGNIYGATSFTNSQLLKMDSTGTIQWDKKYQISTNNDFFTSNNYATLSNGNVVVGATTVIGFDEKPVIRCINPSTGAIVWEKWANTVSSRDLRIHGVDVDSNDNIYVMAQLDQSGTTTATFQMYSFDSTGTVRWNNELSFYDSNPGSGSVNTPYGLIFTGGNVFIIGTVDEHGSTIFRAKPDGTGTGTSLDSNYIYSTLSITWTTSSTTVTENTITNAAGSVTAPVTQATTSANTGITITDHSF